MDLLGMIIANIVAYGVNKTLDMIFSSDDPTSELRATSLPQNLQSNNIDPLLSDFRQGLLERKKENSTFDIDKLLKEIELAKLPIKCSRCNGKGHVDNRDIVRLDMVGQWLPGECKLCSGTGTLYKSQQGFDKLLKRIELAKLPVKCSRCNGKGHVDNRDIVRAGMVGQWLPGECKLCSGTGTL